MSALRRNKEQSFLSPTDEPTVYERGGGTPRLSLQSPHSIQDSQNGDTHIGKDSEPHGSHSDNSQQQNDNLHTNGKGDVLTGYGQCATSYTDGC